MRLMQKTIATLLIICMMFSLVPPQTGMFDGVYENVFAAGGTVGGGSHVTIGTAKRGAAGGAILWDPTIRVHLSRKAETRVDTTEERVKELEDIFSYKYAPFSVGEEALYDTLFFFPSTTWGYFEPWDNNIYAYYSNSPDEGMEHMSDADTNAMFVPIKTQTKPNTNFTNPFKEKVLAAKDAKIINSTQDLANYNWQNYLPGVQEAYAILGYICKNQDNIEQRIREVTDANFCATTGFTPPPPDKLTNEQAFNVAVGYGGLLASLYVIADNHAKADCQLEYSKIAETYATALNDYFSNNNIQENPVTLLFDTCMVYTDKSTYNTTKYCVSPSIDLLEYILAVDNSFSIRESDAFIMEATAGAGGTTREMIMEMAWRSVEVHPFAETKGYMYSSSKPSERKVLRLADRESIYSEWGHSLHNTAIGWAIQVFQLKGTQGCIWIAGGTPSWGKGGEGSYLDMYYMSQRAGIDGYVMVGNQVGDPAPSASYWVDDTLHKCPDTCESTVPLTAPAKITVQLGKESSFLSFVENAAEDTPIRIESSVTRSEYINSLTSEPVEVKVGGYASEGGSADPDMAILQNELDEPSISKTQLIEKMQNVITFNDNSILQHEPYERELNGSKTVLFKYDINLKIYIGEEFWEFKAENMVRKNNGVPLNTAIYLINPYKENDVFCDDIVITKPTSTTMTEVINPSENENLSFNTRMVRRYEYTSSVGKTMAADGVADVSDNSVASFAELKSNTPLQEEFEVLAGIPSSEEIYFSVGGSEYKVAVIMQYWMNEHSRDRTYTMHFEETLCEYNNQEVGKGDTWPGADTGGSNGKTKIPTATGPSSTDYTLNHDGDLEISCTWTGSIPFNGTPWATSGTCAYVGSNSFDWSAYNTALSQAQAWETAIAATIIKWKSASDVYERTYTLEPTHESDQHWSPGSSECPSNGKEGSGQNCTHSPCGGHGSGSNKTPCSNHFCTGSNSSVEKEADGSYTITVKAVIKAHMICGPCCGHELPDLYDTWRQGLVYDYAKISQIRLYLLDQGSVEGMKELVGSDRIIANIVSGNPTYFMNIAQMTEQNNPFYPQKGTASLTGDLQGSGMTFYGSTGKNGDGSDMYSGVQGNWNRWEAQSSRAGRLRYVLDPTQTDSPNFSNASMLKGKGDGGNFTLDRKKVANSQQHDDVIYTIGTRSSICDGMATTNNFNDKFTNPKSSSTNVHPMDTTGHNNEWGKGCLYTNIQDVTDYSSYHNLGSLAYTYDPKELKENDANVTKYKEDYNHHIVRDGGADKATYSDKADTKDTQTAEWKIFDAARRTKIIVDVISDFLILQTSGGDQSIFYFEKVSPATEAQEHFQKIKATQAEMFTENPLSVFNAYEGECAEICPSGENVNIKDGIIGFEIVGGYNGRYDVPSKKYKPYSIVTKKFLNFYNEGWSKYSATYREGNWTAVPGGNYSPHGNSEIITVFDKDPAGTISRPERQAVSQATSLKIYQDNIQILPTSPNKFYQPSGAMLWYSQVAALFSPDTGAMDMEMPGNGLYVGAAKNVDLGHVQRGKYAESWKEYWGNSIGLEIGTNYYLTEDGLSDTDSINGVLVYTPVSVEDALVLPQGSLSIQSNSGKTNVVSRDQRVNAFDTPDMNEMVNKLKVCTLDPATCEYRYLDCKYLHETVLADFNFEPKYMGTEPDYSGTYPQNLKPTEKDNTFKQDGKYITTNLITGVQYELPAGYTITSGGGFGTGNYLSATGSTAWSIPFSDLGLSSASYNRLKISMDLKVNASDNVMLVGFKNIGFVIDGSGKGQYIIPDEKKTTMVGTSKSFGNTMKDVKLDLIVSFNNIIDCTAYVDGVEASVSAVKDYRTVWQDFVNDQGFSSRKQVTDMITLSASDLANNPPADLGVADLGGILNIGTWNNVNTTYNANYYIDNLSIVLMGGTTEHNSSCYSTNTIHTSSRIHVCDDKCYLDQDVYNCDGVLNDDYQLSCTEPEGLPKVTANTFMDFGFDGVSRKVVLTPGTYKLEVWGAEGAKYSGAPGKGGYSVGELTLTETTTLYVNVGGQGVGTTGGYNGGGNGSGHGYAGGGGTDIRIGKDDLYARVIVAGGGGGSQAYFGGAGGGTSGVVGSSGCGSNSGAGTQTTGYAFGQGGPALQGSDGYYGGAGGGGWYGGYGGKTDHSLIDDRGGSGGSGYVYTSSTATNYPAGCLLSSKYYLANASTKVGDTSFVSPTGTNETGHSGDGFARITVMSGGSIEAEQAGTPKTYNYSGSIQTVTLDPGVYLIEAWGAQGSTNGNASSGMGGYSYGELTLDTQTTLYIGVGGSGDSHSGWNGGGTVQSGYGGGATHIATVTGKLSELSSNKDKIIMVAGGGGGGYCSNYGAAGGGGNNAGADASYINGNYGRGGSATYNAYFGQAAYGYRHGGGGGGGYYAGYGGYDCSGGGGGGSGYLSSDLAKSGGTNGVKTGDGQVKITPKGHKHIGTPGQSYPYGCYQTPTVHTHDLNVLGCGLPEGGTGDIYTFDYKGYTQAVTLPAGRYKLEVWGAEGGSSPNYAPGGKGGYSTGIITLTSETTLYVNVGQEGIDGGSGNRESWNGGAAPYTNHQFTSGGGGATDISLKGTANTTTWNSTEHLYSRIIVAGGGGGGGAEWGSGNEYAGAGGGTTGQNAGWAGSRQGSAPGQGGTQTSAGGPAKGGFGYGGKSTTDQSGSGGGGWYGGGGQTSAPDAGGGGGSGYVYTSSTAANYPAGVLLNSEYYLDSASTVAGTDSFAAPGGGNEKGHSGNGYARISNLDHQHSASCYTTQVTCPKIPAGTYVCTGELNTTTDLNTHIHNQACLTDYKDLTPTNFFYTGDAQTYKVPYTDYYRVEVYGAGTNTVGYASGVVKLKAGSNVYVYVGGTDGYNNFASDVRLVKYSDIPGGLSEVEQEIYEKTNETSLASRLMSSGKDKNSAEVFDILNYPLSETVTKGMGGSGTGRVVFTPLNRLPIQKGQKTILNQILDGDIPETQAQKYLGKELADFIINTAQPFKVYENFSWTNYQGFTKVSSNITFANNKLITYITNGASGWEFYVPVNIEAKSLRQIRITLDNNTNTTLIGVGINGGQKEVTTNVEAKKAGQEITIPVSDAWWDDNITSLYFDLFPGTSAETGTISVSKIELIGHADLTQNVSGYGYTELKTISGFSSDDTKGFTVRNNATISYNGSNMRVTANGSDPITDWNTIGSIAADAVKAIKIVFTNNSGAATHGQLFYKSATLGEHEDNSFMWNVGAGTSEQTVWIDTVNKMSYNQTTGGWTYKAGDTWTGNITGMRFDWGALASGSIDVKSITFIGNGSATGTGSYSYKSSVVHTSGKTWPLSYTGASQSITLLPGTYKLEVWGAQGGAYNNGDLAGGKGGYASGKITLSSKTTLTVNVGGQGATTVVNNASYPGTGGWNGGGSSPSSSYNGTHGGGGGGKTDILDGSTYLIAAGGGGGGGHNAGAGNAGGSSLSNYGSGGGGGYCDHRGTGGTSYIGGVSEGTYSSGQQAGDGKAVITALVDIYDNILTADKVTITASTPTTQNIIAKYKNPFENKTTAQQTIFQNIDKIPEYVDGDYNPIFICKFQGFNAHDCENCQVIRRIDCDEPHHKGIKYNPDGTPMKDNYGNDVCIEHYSGANKICWSACGKDSNHKNTITETTVKNPDGSTTTLQLADFLQLDEGFTIYFPNIGDFYGNGQLGLARVQLTRGYGYEDNMDTTRWTREKRVKFPFDVIYDPSPKSGQQMAIYPAGSWIELYVPDEYFNFYLLVENPELANAEVEFECEAINCATNAGLKVKPSISYTERIGTIYQEKLDYFLKNYLQNWYDDILDGGYIRDTAEKNEDGSGNTNTGGTRAGLSDFGYMDFYESKQDNENKAFTEALDYIDTQVEKDFEGTDNDYIDPHHIDGGGSDEYDGINEMMKSRTSNDNKVRVNNAMRTNSLQHLHGAYKSFYLDVIGRIGNFAITDTEDFRFSNFFKVPVSTLDAGSDMTNPNNWLVEGLVQNVDDGVQNLYVGDMYDLRGNPANPNNRWLDTYGTQEWMAGQLTGAGRDVTKPNLVSQILTGEVNNIEVLKEEQLRYGYDIYTSLVTFGNYENGQIQVVPKYYALKVTDKNLEGVPDKYNVPKGTYLPIDIYINKDGVYQPVNVFDNAGNGDPNKGDLKMNDYVFNVDWTVEGDRRNYSLEEIARTNRVKEYFKTIVYDTTGLTQGEDFDLDSVPILDIVEYVTPEGTTNYLGTAQYILMDAKHRTFIGNSDSYDNNPNGDAIWDGRTYSSNFGVDKGAYVDGKNTDNTDRPIEEIHFERAVQRWHGKLGIPSSAVFVPHGEKVDGTTLEYIMGKNQEDWVIVCTAEMIAMGSTWNIYYSQPWFTSMTINGNSFDTCPPNDEDGPHYPGHRDNDDPSKPCDECIPPIIAVFGKTSVDDVEIIQIY